MQLLKYILLILIFLNIPSFSLSYISPTLGSLTSALLLAAIVVFYFLEEKFKPIIPLIVLGITYYFISSLSYTENTSDFIKDVFRFFILILGIRKLTAITTKKELCFILLFGAISILINAVFFKDAFGRYSGFYLNPNKAGFVCIIGFALTYSLKMSSLRLLAQFAFAICGFMTLSRSFILLFIIVNILAVIIDKKNVITLFSGAIALTLILSLSSLQLNADRFGALKSLFSDDVDTTTITKETREETWANYIDGILENPIIGQGYKKLHGRPKGHHHQDVGVHNTFLMIIGEAGIIPFLVIIVFYVSLLIRSFKVIRDEPLYLVISVILLAYLMVSHNYFDNYILLFITIWLYHNLKETIANPININSPQ